MKTQKISKLALWLCMGIAVVLFVAFFVTGLDSIKEEAEESVWADIVTFAMYAYVIVLAGLTIWNLALAVTKFRDSGLIRVITYCGGSIVIYLLFRYLVCGGQEAPEGAEYTGTDMAVADAYIWTIGILFLAAVVVSVICATGILSKSAIKK